MSYITASGLSFYLPDTTKLFSDLNFTFNKGRTAIVGKNGVGKTTLFRLMQNKLKPSEGVISTNAYCEDLPQDLKIFDHLDVLEVLEVKDIYKSYIRIISGDYSELDYETLDNRWNIETEISHTLSRFGFNNIDLNRPYTSFSGGERVRLILSRIMLRNPDFFLMDEPTNNLDRDTKQYIYEFITEWKKGIIVISHDRTLLDLMDHIYELTPKGIKHYMGNYTFYREQKELEENKLRQDIVTAEKEFKKVKRIREESLRKHEKRAQRGKKNRDSIPKMVADGWKGSSEKRYGELRHRSIKRVEAAKERCLSLAERKESTLKIRVDLSGEVKHKTKILVKAESVNYRYDEDDLWNEDISFLIMGQDKVLLSGRNGSGKSTLCRIIAGDLLPSNGVINVNAERISILDQNISCIAPDLTLLENIEQFADPDVPEHKLRIILGGFLFYGDEVFKKAEVLSGGEKMRLAMACIFSTNSTSELLILDEPTNNMDLESIEQLTRSVKEYPGALIVISHDEYFVKDIEVDRVIDL